MSLSILYDVTIVERWLQTTSWEKNKSFLSELQRKYSNYYCSIWSSSEFVEKVTQNLESYRAKYRMYGTLRAIEKVKHTKYQLIITFLLLCHRNFGFSPQHLGFMNNFTLAHRCRTDGISTILLDIQLQKVDCTINQ